MISSAGFFSVLFPVWCVYLFLVAGLVGRSARRLHLARAEKALAQGGEIHRMGPGVFVRPIGVEDLQGPRPLCFLFALRCLLVVGLMLLVAAVTLFRLFCLLVAAQDFEVTEEDVAWANQMRSRNVLF